MNLYQDLTVLLDPNHPGFQKTLVELINQTEGWCVRHDFQEEFRKRGVFRDRDVICIETPFLKFDDKSIKGLIWTYDFGTRLETFNIIPVNLKRLSLYEYNYLLNVFCEAFVFKTAADYHAKVILSNAEMIVTDYVDNDVYEALKRFSECANKSTGHSHPMDEKRWFDFILLASSKERRLSVSYLRGWLVDNGWPSDTAGELGLDYEYGLALLDYEHNRR